TVSMLLCAGLMLVFLEHRWPVFLAIGGMTLGTLGVSYTGIAGAVISTLGLMVLLVQLARSGGVDYRAVAGTGH
ncbi:MAG: hypothetical protein ACN6OP_25440, partial [Pseudomonadales bacterium]